VIWEPAKSPHGSTRIKDRSEGRGGSTGARLGSLAALDAGVAEPGALPVPDPQLAVQHSNPAATTASHTRLPRAGPGALI
jgi:hypothetical protein